MTTSGTIPSAICHAVSDNTSTRCRLWMILATTEPAAQESPVAMARMLLDPCNAQGLRMNIRPRRPSPPPPTARRTPVSPKKTQARTAARKAWCRSGPRSCRPRRSASPEAESGKAAVWNRPRVRSTKGAAAGAARYTRAIINTAAESTARRATKLKGSW